MTDVVNWVAPRDPAKVVDIVMTEAIRDDGQELKPGVNETEALENLENAVKGYREARAAFEADETPETEKALNDAVEQYLLALQQPFGTDAEAERPAWPKGVKAIIRRIIPGNFSEQIRAAARGIDDLVEAEQHRRLASVALMLIRLEGVPDPDSGADFTLSATTFEDRMDEVRRLPEPVWQFVATTLIERAGDPLALKGASNGRRPSKRTSAG